MVVEDHADYRAGIKLALETTSDIRLAGLFSTAESALLHLQNCHSAKQPNVILLDINLPGLSGLGSMRWIRAYAPRAKIIVLTQSDKEADLMTAISQGASGYLLKSATIDQITEGIRTVMAGGASLDARMAQYLLTTLRKQAPQLIGKDLLTRREVEILSLLSEGLLKKEISERLGISTATVSTHVSHIYEKLNVQNAPAAISTAFQAGILPVIRAQAQLDIDQ